MGVQYHSGPSSYRFHELDPEECLGLLKLKRVGRIVWMEEDQPQCLPVNYVMHEDRILFRTSAYSVIAHVASQRSVAFEVDDIDEFVGTGWSILVAGIPSLVQDSSDLPRSIADRPSPWAPGIRNLYIHVLPRRITGRRVISDL